MASQVDFVVDAVVDTSALIAILRGEPDASTHIDTLAQIPRWGIAAVNRTELLMVASSRVAGDGVAFAKELLVRYQIHTLPVDQVLADAAAEAFHRYGKGRHPAGLNFGDCFAYALAKHRDVPLLFKGEDFAKTDVARVA